MTSGGPPPFVGGSIGEILLLLTSRHPGGMELGPNGVAPEIRLKERFIRGGERSEADYEETLQSLIKQHWVERISDRIRLTDEGYKIVST